MYALRSNIVGLPRTLLAKFFLMLPYKAVGNELDLVLDIIYAVARTSKERFEVVVTSFAPRSCTIYTVRLIRDTSDQ